MHGPGQFQLVVAPINTKCFAVVSYPKRPEHSNQGVWRISNVSAQLLMPFYDVAQVCVLPSSLVLISSCWVPRRDVGLPMPAG